MTCQTTVGGEAQLDDKCQAADDSDQGTKKPKKGKGKVSIDVLKCNGI